MPPAKAARPVLLCLALAGCAPFPDIATMPADDGPPPALVPLGDLLDQASPGNADPGPALMARAAALKARTATGIP